MNDFSRQPKIIGFAGRVKVGNCESFRKTVRDELSEMREAMGGRVIAISGAAAGADLIFLRACVDLRIPMIVVVPFSKERFEDGFENPAERELAEKLMGVALARYVAPGGDQAASGNLLEWADALLFSRDGNQACGLQEEAQETGIPSRVIDASSLEAKWAVPPDFHRKARHGFTTRKDLLDFLDLKFAAR